MSTSIATFFALSACLAVPALRAQTAYQSPDLRTELFAGFSTVAQQPGRAGGEGFDRLRLNGWTASATSYHAFRRWGLTAEFSGVSHDRASAQSYLFGGTFRALRRPRFAMTGRVLAGVDRWEPARLMPGAYPTQNSFAFGFGQAIDIKLSENLAFRAQPGFMWVRRQQADGSHRLVLNNPFSLGLVLKFGNR